MPKHPTPIEKEERKCINFISLGVMFCDSAMYFKNFLQTFFDIWIVNIMLLIFNAHCQAKLRKNLVKEKKRVKPQVQRI